MPLGSAYLSENLQLLSDCHCFNNNEMNNVSSYGSFKTLKSVFWYGSCAATALLVGGIPWELAPSKGTGHTCEPWVV